MKPLVIDRHPLPSQLHDAALLVPDGVVQTGILPGVTGVILAGGASSRMGSNKALLPHKGGRFIESIYREMSELFAEVIVVTNTPEQYQFLPCRKVPDLFPGMGALAGLHSGLAHSSLAGIFAVACDMPYLNPALIRHIVGHGSRCDVVLPHSANGHEPLHAFYRKSCLPAMERCLCQGKKRIVSFLPEVTASELPASEVAVFDHSFRSFSNINTPAEYFELRKNLDK